MLDFLQNVITLISDFLQNVSTLISDLLQDVITGQMPQMFYFHLKLTGIERVLCVKLMSVLASARYEHEEAC